MAQPAFDDTTLRALAASFAEREARDSETYPAQNIADLKAHALIGAPFSPALGGHGWTLTDTVLAVGRIAAASPSTALLWSMPLGLSGVYALGAETAPPAYRAAWMEQVEDIAARYRVGELFAACNSERGAGGSLAATTTVAQRGAGGTFTLTGEKILASSGRYAQHFFFTGKVTQDDLPGAGVVELFYVHTDAPGVHIEADWDGFGMRSTESNPVRYTDAAA